MTSKSIGDLRLLGKYSATLTFDRVRNGIFQVDSQGNLTIHPDARWNQYNTKSLLGMFNFDENVELADGKFEVSQPAKVKLLDNGNFELTSRGVLQSINLSSQQSFTPQPTPDVSTSQPTPDVSTSQPTPDVSTSQPTPELDPPETSQETSISARKETIMSQEQTNQTIIKLQNNVLLIRQSDSDNLNEKYDEILDSIEPQTVNNLAHIPARFESDSSQLNPQDNLVKLFNHSHEEKVSETESFRVEVIELVDKEENTGKTWFQAFKDALSSESIQKKLQEFKDNISANLVKLGNKIAALPEEIATFAVIKTALNKVKQGRLLSPEVKGKETYNLGNYQVTASKDNQFSLLDKQGHKLLEFSTDNNFKNPSVISKSSSANASQILKEIKDKPIELHGKLAQQREALINQVSTQMQALPKGRSVGENSQYIVRAYQGEKYLDGGVDNLITNHELKSLPHEKLEDFSQQFEQEHKQIQTETAMPVFTKLLKAHQAYSVNENGSTVEYNLDDKTLTFTNSEGETLKARNLGFGQWEHLDGHLSSTTMSKLKDDLEPKLDDYFRRKAEQDQTRKVLQTLG